LQCLTGPRLLVQLICPCTTAEVFGTLDGVFRVIAEGTEGVREYDFRNGEAPDDYQPLI